MISNRMKDKKMPKMRRPYCYYCGSDLTEQAGFRSGLKAWICTECRSNTIFKEDPGKRFPGVIQICDSCGTVLDNQEGFTDWLDKWVCKECGESIIVNDAE